MRLVRYEDAGNFQSRISPLLEQREVENNLTIGIIERGVHTRETDGWLMACIEEEGGLIALIALMTPPHNLLLNAVGDSVPEEAVEALSIALGEEGIVLPGVLAEKKLAHCFAKYYAKERNATFSVTMQERVYVLNRVADIPLIGQIRPAQENDMHYLPYWFKGFHEDCFGGFHELDAQGTLRRITEQGLFILEVDGNPVSMAGIARSMPHGRSIGPVYTPPYLRGRGYASSCVALLSQKVLDDGNDYCVLFADIANPASNGAYLKVGYQAVSDYAQLRFEEVIEK